MDISSILSNYIKSLNSVNPTNNASTTSNTDTSTTDTSLKDQLIIGSNNPDLSGYLNYNAGGNYNNLASLADFLGNDDNSQDSGIIDLLGDGSTGTANSQSGLDSLLGMGGNSRQDNSDSIDSMFNTLIEENTQYVDTLISNALAKLNAKNNQTENSKDDDKDTNDSSAVNSAPEVK